MTKDVAVVRENGRMQRTIITLCLSAALAMCCAGGSTGTIPGPAGDLFYDDGGTGDPPAVAFVHAFAGDSSHWSPVLDHLRRGRRALALDLRAHGRSADPGRDYTIPDLADDVAALLDGLAERRETGDLEERGAGDAASQQRYILVGHSLGGLVALEYAARFPERVAGLYLLDSAGAALLLPAPVQAAILRQVEADRHAESIEAYWADLLTGASPALRERLLGGLRRMSRPALVGLTHGLFAYDPRPALARYRGPMQALVTPANRSESTALHVLRPDIPVKAVQISGESVGHWWHLDHPERFARYLDEFLARVDSIK
jgi:pimeloyl-ACP methyl ester carboxylesterase